MAEHDGGYKLLFSHPRTVEELLRGFVHESWVERLDFSSLERVGASFVSHDLRERHSDSIWRLRLHGGGRHWLYVYLLLEFQSTPDPFMAIRLLGYVALLLDELLRRERPAPGESLPIVLPLVLYNGKRRWTAPLDLGRLYRGVPRELRRYLPSLRYLLIDERSLGPEDLARGDSLVAALFRLETCAPEGIRREVDRLAGLLARDEEPELWRAFGVWLERLVRRTFRGATIPEGVTLEDAAMLEETLREWGEKLQAQARREGRAEGRQEGRREGLTSARRILLQLLRQRFGPVPQVVIRRVRAIDSASELERLAARVLKARSLQEMGLS